MHTCSNIYLYMHLCLFLPTLLPCSRLVNSSVHMSLYERAYMNVCTYEYKHCENTHVHKKHTRSRKSVFLHENISNVHVNIQVHGDGYMTIKASNLPSWNGGLHEI